MFWKLQRQDASEAKVEESRQAAGRFVLHRHRDGWGEHLDLRLEQGGCLLGWRIDAASLDGEPWASDKPPHPVTWLERDRDAVREDAGEYTWLERGSLRKKVLLRGQRGAWIIEAERVTSVTPTMVRALVETAERAGLTIEELDRAAADGITARRRAMARLCGLGRELDGGSFDEALTRRMLSGLSLEELHRQLEAYEKRFDSLYPPQPVSQPEPLDEEGAGQASTLLHLLQE